MTENRRVALVALASIGCSFVSYVVLAGRDVMFGDGPELTAAAVTDGVAHPGVIRFWVVLGHIASLPRKRRDRSVTPASMGWYRA